jgi:ribonuclease inhibitor
MTKKAAKPKRSKRGSRVVIPAGVTSIDAVYDILARDLDLPAHFGRNLDALYDALTGDVEGPFEIVVEDPEALASALGAKGRALLTLLRDLAKARRDVNITLRVGR